MGRSKIYRQNLNALVNSVSSKTLYNWFFEQTRTRFGVASQEAELIAKKAEMFLSDILKTPIGNTVIINLPTINNNQKKLFNSFKTSPVQVTIYSHDELNIYLKYGLKNLQNNRLCKMIEEAYFQNTVFTYNCLCLLSNITAKSIRERLIPLWNKGIRMPIQATSKKYRQFTSFRSTYVLNCYFEGNSLDTLQKLYFFSDSQWIQWIRDFLIFSNVDSTSKNKLMVFTSSELVEEYKNLYNKVKNTSQYSDFYNSFKHLVPVESFNITKTQKELFIADLQYNHGFSKAKSSMYLQLISEFKNIIDKYKNKKNVILYFATSDKESPGKPLSISNMKPISLSIWTDNDIEITNLNSTENLKWEKLLRLSTEAYNQGTCLNQFDISFLLAIHPGVIQKLIKTHQNIVLPLRGNITDMGPGITHAEKIIELYLQGYTETEILRRTGHTYSSIERYLVMFSRVVNLLDRCMPIPLIRQTIGCSVKLVEKYSQLYYKYNIPDYQFNLMQIRHIFNNNIKKNTFPQKRSSIWED